MPPCTHTKLAGTSRHLLMTLLIVSHTRITVKRLSDCVIPFTGNLIVFSENQHECVYFTESYAET